MIQQMFPVIRANDGSEILIRGDEGCAAFAIWQDHTTAYNFLKEQEEKQKLEDEWWEERYRQAPELPEGFENM